LNHFPFKIIELSRVNSTNEYALRLLNSQEIPEGTVIRAQDQFEGKGQGDNKWMSEPGKNLTFSLVVHPVFLKPEKQFFLNEAVVLGVVDFTRSLLPDGNISLKWPNDIYAGTCKLGGILINNIISGRLMESSVIGIGVNINQAEFSNQLPNPVSLKLLLKSETELRSALIKLCKLVESRYNQLRNKDFDDLHKDYCYTLLGFDSWRKYSIGDHEIEGKITGVTETGRLLVQTRIGEILVFDHKEIEYLF
jgi:BirA family biotin operon repressor/biotin-[acetyl-CoA-carboxylase] ligase